MQLCRSEISVPTRTAQTCISTSPSPTRRRLDFKNPSTHIIIETLIEPQISTCNSFKFEWNLSFPPWFFLFGFSRKSLCLLWCLFVQIFTFWCMCGSPRRISHSKDIKNLTKLLEDNEKVLWPNYTEVTRLSFLLRLFQLKSLGGLTNKHFTMLLDILRKALPCGNESMPKSYYEAKKLSWYLVLIMLRLMLFLMIVSYTTKRYRGLPQV